MATEPPIGGDPVALTPACFDRHDEAVAYVEKMTRTRDPALRNGRFPGVRAGAWGLLESGSTITAGSGTMLGSGTVKLCDREGTPDEDAEDVDVVNAGAAISASGGDRIVRLGWTDGEWCVTCIGGS